MKEALICYIIEIRKRNIDLGANIVGPLQGVKCQTNAITILGMKYIIHFETQELFIHALLRLF